jgi:hypothetical protein
MAIAAPDVVRRATEFGIAWRWLEGQSRRKREAGIAA